LDPRQQPLFVSAAAAAAAVVPPHPQHSTLFLSRNHKSVHNNNIHNNIHNNSDHTLVGVVAECSPILIMISTGILILIKIIIVHINIIISNIISSNISMILDP
jgi:hypothetical protein